VNLAKVLTEDNWHQGRPRSHPVFGHWGGDILDTSPASSPINGESKNKKARIILTGLLYTGSTYFELLLSPHPMKFIQSKYLLLNMAP